MPLSHESTDGNLSVEGADQNLTIDTEQSIPLPRKVALGAQQLLVSNVWLDPLFIGSAAGLGAALSTNLLTATLLAAGVATLLQTTKLVKLPVVEGPSSAFSPLAIAYAKAGSLAAAGTGLLIGAAIVLLAAATGVLGKIRRVLSSAVTGTIILLVGLSLAGFTIQEFFGMPGTENFATPSTILIATVTTAVVVLGGMFTGKFRSFCFLIALVVGNLLAFALGRLDFSGVSAAPWLRFPTLLPYGSLTFDLGITVTMCIVFFVAVVEAIGIYEATARLTRLPLTERQINAGVAGEAGGSMLSALFGGFGTTAYAQNLGVVRITGIGSRFVVRVAALMMIALAMFPKVAAVLVTTPAPVIGGLFLPAAATVVITGAQAAFRDRGNSTHNLIAPLALMAGLGVPALTGSLVGVWPELVVQLATQGIVVGAVVAIVLECLFVVIPNALARRGNRKSKSTL
ncbi:hypothetical protein C7T36_26600 [Rhodococcus sp. AD45-ID]|jgi:uracil-xanthine permease|uniref:uracil-xanthine permease family protein n=1 Tax=unclassified Rhodococcus (in: high G+C Gram-positive bacteria) TaxID=192944 RepID=UPI0005D39077|nr:MULTISPECIES: solute carrier family 23 protein [unclassified Rhodococcus (in: high G+C Gram-positive bacteria)]KJF21055.1 Xanthine permease XanP [Rhodococcus sp. AD45]PSR38593.1 hypothetical protein C7T36_26600 [Rhodococcus sp. AD45-ID]